VAAFAGCATILSAQAIDPDTYKVNYFEYNLESDVNYINVTNVGTSGGNLCADIYVFDPNQELSECCSCLLTPDGLSTISVHYNLTDNPLTGGVYLDTGVIKIVSAATTGGACPFPTGPKPAPGIHAWGTHLNNSGGTETDFQDSGLSAAELGSLAAQCKAIKLVGSGAGVCACANAG
jgi:hypothetical protein